MRDLLSKLDRILVEETTLQDLKKEPLARDPVIAKAIKDKEREESAKIAAKISDDEIEFGSLARRHNDKEDAERSADLDAQDYHKEGYQVVRGIDKERYQSRDGLEGPFSAKNGKVVYYDPKEGKYYDPDSDFYIDHDEWQAMNENILEDTKIGDPVYIKGCEWDEVVEWLVKNVGPITDKNQNYANGWRGKGWLLYPTGRSDENGIEVLEVSANTRLPNKRALAKAIQDNCGTKYKTGYLYKENIFQVGDGFDISISEDYEIGAEVVDILEDGVVIELDDVALEYLSRQGFTFEEDELVEGKKKGLDGKACWKGYRYAGTKMKGGKRVDDCVKVKESGLQYYTGKKKYGKDGMAALAAAGRKGASEEELGRIKDKYKKEELASDFEVEKEDLELEAKYQGREVPLGKPMKGDVKKSKVYVKNPKGNVVKVNFGDKKMRIKKSNPKRRKSFRARHNCANPGPRHKARYWSCRSW